MCSYAIVILDFGKVRYRSVKNFERIPNVGENFSLGLSNYYKITNIFWVTKTKEEIKLSSTPNIIGQTIPYVYCEVKLGNFDLSNKDINLLETYNFKKIDELSTPSIQDLDSEDLNLEPSVGNMINFNNE